MLPADHLIEDADAFCRAVYTADRYAGGGYLITFGVVPDKPETGYGYIRKGRAFYKDTENQRDEEAYAIEQFVEKPDRQTAEKYLASERYCWNSGMFFFRAVDIYEELERLAPEITEACRQAWRRGSSEKGAFLLDAGAFSDCPSDSIDYAVMEKTQKGVMVPFEAGWSDLGSWEAIWETGVKDGEGNVLEGEVIARGVKDSLVFSSRRLVAVLGMTEGVVVDTPDALLVAERSQAQEVKSLASKLKAENRMEALCHGTSYKPWGLESQIAKDSGHTIRRLSVKPSMRLEFVAPGGQTSHWSVISGAGRIRRNGQNAELCKGGFLELAPRTGIEVENTGREPLVIIEVCVTI